VSNGVAAREPSRVMAMRHFALGGVLRQAVPLARIVHNEALNTDRYSLTPVPPVSRGRAVMVKYTQSGPGEPGSRA
jgi:hypothetical protein